MKVNNPTIKAKLHAYNPSKLIQKEIDREIIRILIETGKGNKVKSDLIPFKAIKQHESRN